jgi:O-antigen/teichoic acid export membrane protein
MSRLGLSPDSVFDSRALKEGLGGRSARGGLATLGGQGARALLQMAATVILARLLAPSDYGLIGMVSVVTGFALLFRDAGLSIPTIQLPEISREEVSALFWVSIAASVMLTIVVLACAPLVAAIYRQPELTGITAALSASLLLSGVSIQHEALLRRHMRFVELGLSRVAAQAASLVVTVSAALMGASYWSLVYGQLTSAAVASALAFYYCPWVPGRWQRGVGIRRHLAIGGDVTGFKVVNYFAENSDYILIGRFIGSGPLGLYTRAYQLFRLPMTQVTSPLMAVALPALSALRETPRRYTAYFRRVLSLLSLVAVPLSAYCILEGDFIVRLLLGEQWLAVIPAFRVLAVGGLVQTVASTRGLVLLSSGMSRKYLQLGVVASVVRVLGVVCGLSFGIVGVAAGTSVAILAFFVPSLYYFMRGTGIVPTDYFRALGLPLAYAASACAAGILPKVLFAQENWVLTNVVVTAVFVLVYGGLALSNKSIRDSLRYLRGAIQTKPNAPPAMEEEIVMEHDRP